jgi:polyhydroxyalkanoate synthesis regulator phasin
MEDLFDRTVNFGLGLFDYTREQVEKLVDDMVKRGEVHRKDAQGLVGQIVERGEEQRKAIEQLVRQEVDRALGKTADALHVARKEDVLSPEAMRKIVREEISAALKAQERKAAPKPKAPPKPKTPPPAK